MRFGRLVAVSLSLISTVALMNCGGGGSSGGSPCTDNPITRADVFTYHNDNARTGQNLEESVLTPAKVNSTGFGRLNFLPVDGKVDAQPLYVSNISVNGVLHNVLYVATEHDSVYAFDADTGATIWQGSLLGPGEA